MDAHQMTQIEAILRDQRAPSDKDYTATLQRIIYWLRQTQDAERGHRCAVCEDMKERVRKAIGDAP